MKIACITKVFVVDGGQIWRQCWFQFLAGLEQYLQVSAFSHHTNTTFLNPSPQNRNPSSVDFRDDEAIANIYISAFFR